MKRVYENMIRHHIAKFSQMAFLAGPRQVGKTTVSKTLMKGRDAHYLNWDIDDNRHLLIEGAKATAKSLNIIATIGAGNKKPLIVFDEIHKYSQWKNYLKGFIDLYKGTTDILVTGSAKLNIYKAGGDSLMGRYFLYRVHPLSVGELLNPSLPPKEMVRPPQKISQAKFNQLLSFGGFPEPFIKKDQQFSLQWQRLRRQQLFREDIRDLTQVQEIGQLEIFAEMLYQQVGGLFNRSNLAKLTKVAISTISRWLETLQQFYYCFTIQPWSHNISRSLLKEPKVYLWDWSTIKDPGARSENFIAVHLLKAVQVWTDLGFGQFGLYFVRDKDKNEVDFLVVKDEKPWFLVEVKNKNTHLSSALVKFQRATGAKHAFQVIMDMDYIEADCFKTTQPVLVPAITLLSQLV